MLSLVEFHRSFVRSENRLCRLGALATVVTHPFDTVKSIRQVQLGRENQKSRERTSDVLRRLYNERGIRGWYKGLIPRLLKVSPACAIMISTIEFFRQNVFQ